MAQIQPHAQCLREGNAHAHTRARKEIKAKGAALHRKHTVLINTHKLLASLALAVWLVPQTVGSGAGGCAGLSAARWTSACICTLRAGICDTPPCAGNEALHFFAARTRLSGVSRVGLLCLRGGRGGGRGHRTRSMQYPEEVVTRLMRCVWGGVMGSWWREVSTCTRGGAGGRRL